ncbi:sigma-70 family RNA polymerase sigma factor, partial [Streptococcus pneumoniae]
ITGELKRDLRDHSWVIQPPREIQELQIEIRREHPLLCQVLGREPRLHELAAHLGQPIPRVAEAVVSQSGRHPDSLDVVHNGRTLEEQLPDACNDEFAALYDSLMLSGALRQLDPDEKLMLRLRYFEDESQQRIGERMRMSQVQVSRALARILQKLQRHILAQFPHTAGERGT